MGNILKIWFPNNLPNFINWVIIEPWVWSPLLQKCLQANFILINPFEVYLEF